MYLELKPLYWPAVCVWLFTQALLNGVDGWILFGLANAAWAWWWYRNLDDDDRWKRRREKLAERVSIVGSRLTVVPATGGA